jgi:iron complex outermembrane receptor protein
LDFVLGAFQVRKPYFNVDSNAVYRQEGRITNQGLELSATMTPMNGVKVIAGFVRNHPQVDFSVGPVSSQVPVGPVPSTINLNGDFSLPSWRGWGASVEWTRLSSRTETDDGRFELPPLSTLNVGLRLARRCLDHPCSVRLDVNNVTDASGLNISSQYIVLPQLRRNYTLTAAIDI